jgi:hypothetical protein
MANETVTTINFKHEIEHFLPHPDESCIVTFLGKAIITQETEDEKTWTGVEIVELWLGVDVPSEALGLHFRKVAHTGLKGLQNDLETAALDAFESPQAVTLPSEIDSLDTLNLRPHTIFTQS